MVRRSGLRPPSWSVVALPLRGRADALLLGYRQIELIHQQDNATSTRVEIRRSLGDGVLSARWESHADVDGGAYRAPHFTRRWIVAAQDTTV